MAEGSKQNSYMQQTLGLKSNHENLGSGFLFAPMPSFLYRINVKFLAYFAIVIVRPGRKVLLPLSSKETLANNFIIFFVAIVLCPNTTPYCLRKISDCTIPKTLVERLTLNIF